MQRRSLLKLGLVSGAVLALAGGAAVHLPVPVQGELSQLLGLLCTAPGRLGLAGLGPDWGDATETQVQAALESMRFSSLALRQQAYQALHEIVGGAYFSDESTWVAVGYPGPLAL